MFNKSLFSTGFESLKEREVEQKQKAGHFNQGLFSFYVPDGGEALMRFLTEKPVSFMAHTIKVGKAPRTFVCTENDECMGCKQSDSYDPSKPNRASLKVAFLVLDGREVEVDEKVDGKPTGKKKVITDQIKIMVRGVNDAANIQRSAVKYGLTNGTYTCFKNGAKNPYNFEREVGCPPSKDAKFWSQEPLSQEALNELIEKLPERYREMAKGEGGLYEVLCSQFSPYGETATVEEPVGLKRL